MTSEVRQVGCDPEKMRARGLHGNTPGGISGLGKGAQPGKIESWILEHSKNLSVGSHGSERCREFADFDQGEPACSVQDGIPDIDAVIPGQAVTGPWQQDRVREQETPVTDVLPDEKKLIAQDQSLKLIRREAAATRCAVF